MAGGRRAGVQNTRHPSLVPGTHSHQLLVEEAVRTEEVAVGAAGVEDVRLVDQLPVPLPGAGGRLLRGVRAVHGCGREEIVKLNWCIFQKHCVWYWEELLTWETYWPDLRCVPSASNYTGHIVLFHKVVPLKEEFLGLASVAHAGVEIHRKPIPDQLDLVFLRWLENAVTRGWGSLTSGGLRHWIQLQVSRTSVLVHV